MKKAGILTFNRALNYGAVLQAYALKCVCETIGFETHIIDYYKGEDGGPHPVKSFLKASDKRKAFIRFLKSILSYRWDRKRWEAFGAFRRAFLNESTACGTADQVAELNYDAYIMGSDQIWNCNITGGKFDPVFFGNLPGKPLSIVYGASAQDVPFPLNEELAFSKELSRSDAAIGIREKKLADYVESLTGEQFPIVVDPTILAGKEALQQIESRWTPRKPYILIYQIDFNPTSDISIRSLEKRFKCRVYSMTVPKFGSVHGKKGAFGPDKFLALLDHAEFLVTNSFHGVALSLLWHKQFYVYENGGVMERIDNLLNSLNLSNRKVRNVSDIDLNLTIDYSEVDLLLEKQQQESMAFLTASLHGEDYKPVCRDAERTDPVRFSQREKKDCSGCTACKEICPVSAIEMSLDEEGFLYPKIIESKCIQCGKCDKFCSFSSVPKRPGKGLPEAYGAKHNNLQTRMTSRSGGAFVAISDVILNRGGIVYGASMEKECVVRHIRANSAVERDMMKGAKYVQSDLTGIYKQVLDDLKSDKAVLFSGTPCQVAGLYSLLDQKKVPSHNLFSCDLVCHGVPSPQVWADYCHYIEKRYHSRIVTADFRDKSFGWDTHCESFVLENGKKIVSKDFADLFYSHIMFRPSCHNCHFANTRRVGDITLADFWGIEKSDSSFKDSKGVSLVLVNSEKGKQLFSEAAKYMDIISCNVLNCLQPTLIKPSTPSANRELFWKNYWEKGFEATLKKYTKPVSIFSRMKRSLKQILYLLKLRKYP